MSDPVHKPGRMEWTPERVRRFWDYEATHPERYFTYKYASSLVSTVERSLGGARRVLDYGCGRGFLTEKLLDAGLEVAAVDYSSRSVELVQQHLEPRRGFLGARTVDQLHSSTDRYDAVFVIEVIEHLDDTALEELFERVRSVASPGARIVVTTPNAERLDDSEVYCASCDQTFHRWGHVRTWTADSLTDYLQSIGLADIRTIECRLAKVVSDRPWQSLWGRIWKSIKVGRKRPHLVAIARVPSPR